MLCDIDIQQAAEYLDYWESIRPTTDDARWRRWVFAFLSIQRNWRANYEAYECVMELPWTSQSELEDVLRGCKAGLHNRHADYIWRFTELCTSAPRVLRGPKEVGFKTWSGWRNRLIDMEDIKGIGIAKIAFAQEMCYPAECGVTCFDRHGARLYGVDPDNVTPLQYGEMENHWQYVCHQIGISPAMARHIVWDRLQGADSTRYWSHVFEEEDTRLLVSLDDFR